MEYSIQKFIKKRPKTKIVCTIGPASSEVKTLKKMISEGMSVARLNLSHGTINQHKLYVENARQAAIVIIVNHRRVICVGIILVFAKNGVNLAAIG